MFEDLPEDGIAELIEQQFKKHNCSSYDYRDIADSYWLVNELIQFVPELTTRQLVEEIVSYAAFDLQHVAMIVRYLKSDYNLAANFEMYSNTLMRHSQNAIVINFSNLLWMYLEYVFSLSSESYIKTVCNDNTL